MRKRRRGGGSGEGGGESGTQRFDPAVRGAGVRGWRVCIGSPMIPCHVPPVYMCILCIYVHTRVYMCIYVYIRVYVCIY